MDFKISDTNKGKKSLIYDGFIYRIDGVLKCGDISWWCTNKKCKGRLRTDSAMSTMNAINLEHIHEHVEKKVERQKLRSQVKRKATDDLTSRPQRLANGSTILNLVIYTTIVCLTCPSDI